MTLTPLKHTVRRRVMIGGKSHELTLDSDAGEVVVRRMYCRTEWRLPFAMLLESIEEPLFAQQRLRERQRKAKRP